jgi:hypothetical protein
LAISLSTQVCHLLYSLYLLSDIGFQLAELHFT